MDSHAKGPGSNPAEEISNFVGNFPRWVVETDEPFICVRHHRFRYLSSVKMMAKVAGAYRIRNWRLKPYRVLNKEPMGYMVAAVVLKLGIQRPY